VGSTVGYEEVNINVKQKSIITFNNRFMFLMVLFKLFSHIHHFNVEQVLKAGHSESTQLSQEIHLCVGISISY
jgi:hypothetical protein